MFWEKVILSDVKRGLYLGSPNSGWDHYFSPTMICFKLSKKYIFKVSSIKLVSVKREHNSAAPSLYFYSSFHCQCSSPPWPPASFIPCPPRHAAALYSALTNRSSCVFNLLSLERITPTKYLAGSVLVLFSKIVLITWYDTNEPGKRYAR